MATRHKLTCIETTDQTGGVQIISIGGTSSSGPWKRSAQQAIRLIESGVCGFYVTRGGQEVDVVVSSWPGRKVLELAADGTGAASLLYLQECARV